MAEASRSPLTVRIHSEVLASDWIRIRGAICGVAGDFEFVAETGCFARRVSAAVAADTGDGVGSDDVRRASDGCADGRCGNHADGDLFWVGATVKYLGVHPKYVFGLTIDKSQKSVIL